MTQTICRGGSLETNANGYGEGCKVAAVLLHGSTGPPSEFATTLTRDRRPRMSYPDFDISLFLVFGFQGRLETPQESQGTQSYGYAWKQTGHSNKFHGNFKAYVHAMPKRDH